MLNKFVKKKAIPVYIAFFISVFILSPLPIASASLPLPTVELQEKNPYSTPVIIDNIPNDSFRWMKRDGKTIYNVALDLHNPNRIYLLEESSPEKTLSLRYHYDEVKETVTILFSETPQNAGKQYSYYYQFQLSPSFSFNQILEEGWIKNGELLPSHLYDYYRGTVQTRIFDKEGKLLRIESSQGFQRELFYTRGGKLLTIKDTGPIAGYQFFDQIIPSSKALEGARRLPQQDPPLYTIPSRDKEKNLVAQSFKKLALDLGFDLKGRKLFAADTNAYLLEWLTSANHLRAGPMAGGKLL